jgi:hypothetical protein
LSLEDVALLLDGERDLVRKARMIGLRELLQRTIPFHVITRHNQVFLPQVIRGSLGFLRSANR